MLKKIIVYHNTKKIKIVSIEIETEKNINLLRFYYSKHNKGYYIYCIFVHFHLLDLLMYLDLHQLR